MRRTLTTLLLSAVAGGALLFTMPASSGATDVTPVRHRHHYRHHYVPHHGYYRHWYPRRHYYHHGPRVHVYRYPHHYWGHRWHGGVHVGPLGIHW